jgi:hypothetical protein
VISLATNLMNVPSPVVPMADKVALVTVPHPVIGALTYLVLVSVLLAIALQLQHPLVIAPHPVTERCRPQTQSHVSHLNRKPTMSHWLEMITPLRANTMNLLSQPFSFVASISQKNRR